MKKYLPLVLALLILTFSGATGAYALSTFSTCQGGTGTSTPTGILYGDGLNNCTTTNNPLKTVTIGSNLTFSGGVLSATGGGSGSPGGASSTIQFNLNGAFGGLRTLITDGTNLFLNALLTVYGGVTASSVTATSTATVSTLANQDGVLTATAFTGADIGAQINAAYAALPSTGGTVKVPAGAFSFSTPIVFGTSGKNASLLCDTDTYLTYTGSATSTTMNMGQGTGADGQSISNCHFIGSSSSGTQVAIQLGGSNGNKNFILNNDEISTFGLAVGTEANTYLETFNNDFVHNNNKAFSFQSATNAGENIRFLGGTWADCLTANALACIDFSTFGAADVTFVATSFDDAQVHIGNGTRSASFLGGHFENPAADTLTAYTPLLIDSSTANVTVNGTIFENGANTQRPAQYIKNGSTLTVVSATVEDYGAGTKGVADFVTNTGSGWTKVESINKQDAAYTNLYNSTGGTGTIQYAQQDTGKLGIATSTPAYQVSVSSTTSSNSIDGIQYTDATLPANGQVLMGVDNIGGTTAEPALWMSNYANVPSSSNYILELDDFGSGTTLNAANTNPISFRVNNVTKAILANGGNFGIGSTTPGTLLSLGNTGGINLSLATSTFQGGININSGCYAVNGTCLSTGGGGTNFFTSDGVSTTYLNNNPILAAPSFNATSTIATSTFAGDVWIGSNGVRPNPDLRIGTSSLPLYGRVLGDVIDAEYDYNGVTSINVANANIGTCAASTYFADGNNPTLGGYYGTFSFLNDGWTDGAGAGCGIGVSNTDKPEAVAIASPTGGMDFDIATSSAAAGFGDFNWNVNNATKMVLTNGGNVGIGTTTPFATLSIQTPAAAPSVQQNCIFAVASTTATGATTQMSYCNGVGATTQVLNVNGALNLTGGNGATAAIDFSGTAKISINASQTTFSQGAGSASSWLYSPPATTGLGTTANIPYISFDPTSVNRGHASGAIAEQDDFQITAAQNSFASGAANVSTIGTSTAVAINGIPNIEIRGASANSFGLLLNATSTLNASTTNSYAFGAFHSSGATNNYAAWIDGRILATNLNTSTAGNAVCQLTTGELVTAGASTCVTSSQFTKSDINSLSPQQAMQEILGLDITTYKYDDSGTVGVGPIAEQAAKVASNIVDYANKDFTLDGHKFKKGDAVGIEPLSEAGLALAGVKYEQTEILAIKIGHDAQDSWQDLFIGLLLVAVAYLYYEVRKLKRL